MDIKYPLKLKTVKYAIRPSYGAKVRCMEDHIKLIFKEHGGHEYTPYRMHK